MTTDTIYCPKCKRVLKKTEYYTSYNLEKYPNEGKLDLCKKCATMHVDNWNPDTFLWILQEIDVPWIPKEWNKLMANYANDPEKLTGMTIIGRYLSKMKLNQYKKYRWKDNEFLQKLADAEIEEAMTRQGFGAAEIAEAQIQANHTLNLPEKPVTFVAGENDSPTTFGTGFSLEDEDDDFDDDLTEEDKTYLKLKWGKTYKPDEWIKLEQLYTEMMDSYDIQQAGDINTLKIVCKCSLKANQLLDLGDIEGAQKMAKMYESLMKSGKWTAAQNKTAEEEAVDSVGQLVAICEKEGFIPRYYIAEPKDHVDRVIEDMQKYTHDLILNESGLGSMIESAFKQMEEEKERIQAASEMTEEEDEQSLFDYDKPPITFEDKLEFLEFEEDLDNDEIMKMLLEEEDEE